MIKILFNFLTKINLVYKINFTKIFFLLSIFYLFTYFFFLFNFDIPGNLDSSVYILNGNLINQGKEIYKDFWDHKGPILYLINYIGALIKNNGSIGINLVELILLTLLIIFL